MPYYFLFVPPNFTQASFHVSLGTSNPRRRKQTNNAYAEFEGTDKEYYGIFRSGLLHWEKENEKTSNNIKKELKDTSS